MAIARRPAFGSTTMILAHPCTAPAMAALKPTPPPPETTRDEPALARKAFMTAPAPVCTPQPSGPSSSNGASDRTLTTLRSLATEYAAKEDCPKKCPPTATPFCSSAELPSRRKPVILRPPKSRQYAGSEERQVGHTP